MTIGTTVTTV